MSEIYKAKISRLEAKIRSKNRTILITTILIAVILAMQFYELYGK